MRESRLPALGSVRVTETLAAGISFCYSPNEPLSGSALNVAWEQSPQLLQGVSQVMLARRAMFRIVWLWFLVFFLN